MIQSKKERFRKRLHEIIYEADTPAGKLFDIILLLVIIVSIAAIMFESVATINVKYGSQLAIIEWVITILFTIEYIARIVAVKKPKVYIFSFYGIIDFIATLPSYLGLFIGGFHFLLLLRAVRLLRVFRILNMGRMVGASNSLARSIKKSSSKIMVFLFAVIVLCIILGTIMYMIEGPSNGFSSIPMSIYWTVVTLTTVGFGDITPQTAVGQFFSVVIMILGYGIIAVPTGLITAQMVIRKEEEPTNTQECRFCGSADHKNKAHFCDNCGNSLKE